MKKNKIYLESGLKWLGNIVAPYAHLKWISRYVGIVDKD